MPDKTECLQHIQKTVDLLYALEEFENMAFVKALALGIQGKKRESRADGIKDTNIRKYLQSEAYDLFETEIYPVRTNMKSLDVTSIEAFLMEYRKGLWDMYWKLMEAANMFVSPLCMRDLAAPLYERASCIKKAIVDLNRKLKRWKDVKEQGTPLHDLMIYESTAYNNHDEAERKENALGYKY